MNNPFRHTKIIATIGPASQTSEKLAALMDAGTDLFRLNFSHGNHAEKAAVIREIRFLSRQRRQAMAIVGDLQGPKIRVGQIPGDTATLIPGQPVNLTTRQDADEPPGNIPVVFPALPTVSAPGDKILLDDGLLELEVVRIAGPKVECKVVTGGVLASRKGVNLPGAALSLPSITEKDWEDALFCIREGVDYLALSFVRQASDIAKLRDFLSSNGADIPILAKIEKPQAVDNFTEILHVADGIMVARGDLGVEIGPEQVPLIQKRIIRKCREAGKPVITATQMLESMVSHPRPTRAETSDVANAIIDGSDAVMLSGETAVGSYPVEAVSLMAGIARSVEGDPMLASRIFHYYPATTGPRSLSDAIGEAACRTAENIGAAAILAFTQSGSTAALVARNRPPIPIFAVTPSRAVRRRMALYSGVRSIQVDFQGSTEAQIHSMEESVIEAGVLQRGDLVVITMGSPVAAKGTTNLMKVHRLGTGPLYEIE
ncbi:MAG: pyruvate kinase [Syntrophotaleaceae bacterium]